ncbi:MAG TPA: hypothetical protein VNX47_07575 [Nevskia sp.]|nr:hypothetical protein [Nevskia sp.]
MADADTLELLLPAAAATALEHAEVGDPYALLGPHRSGRDTVLRAWLPRALQVEVLERGGTEWKPLQAVQLPGLFVGRIAEGSGYRLRIHWPGAVQETEDPYSFGLLLGELDLHLIAEGNHRELGPAWAHSR